jgi:hypothetical protein
MKASKLNHWLVILGVLLILVGIVDAVGVVQATPSSALTQPAEPPEDFGPAERESPPARKEVGLATCHGRLCMGRACRSRVFKRTK